MVVLEAVLDGLSDTDKPATGDLAEDGEELLKRLVRHELAKDDGVQ
jgi:hypothetical protein